MTDRQARAREPKTDAAKGGQGEGDRPRVQSVARAASLLLAVARSPTGLTTKEISEQVRISRQTTYHLLHTLLATGLIARADRTRYVVGLRVATLAEAFHRHLAPAEHLIPHVREIARMTGETAYALGWWQGEIVIFGTARGSNVVQAIEMPHAAYTSAHARASGKLLLAYASPEMREQYLRHHPLVACTEKTITDRDRLEAELAAIRRQGYAVDREEFARGLCCLAVPIDHGMSPFAFVLSAPVERFEATLDSNLSALLAIAETLGDTAG